MALFHEGIGQIEEVNKASIPKNKRVCIVPNIPGYLLEHKSKENCCDSCKHGGSDNYCERARFLGSGYDGIGQSRIVLPRQNVVIIPDSVPDEIAILAE